LSDVANTESLGLVSRLTKEKTKIMSTTASKPPATGTPRRETTARTNSSSPAAANRTPARSSTPTTNGAGGVARTRSVRSGTNGALVSARAAVKKPAASSNLSSTSQVDAVDDDARDEQVALVQDLKDRLQKAESEAEERQKVVEVLNARLDDALTEQAKLEERAHEEEEKVESLENEKRDLTRQHRELEGIYEAERAQIMKEKEDTQTREEEMQGTIQRLKETMATKHMPTAEPEEEQHMSRACKSRYPPPRTWPPCAY
jgi:myosin heavy subunit